jgi:hypothetical protein
MTIIRSNPNEDTQLFDDADSGIGSGPIQLNITEEQLQLITAYLCHTRLGSRTVYTEAAGDLLGEIIDEMGDIFTDDATRGVDLQVTIEDDSGNVIVKTFGHDYDITLEV